MIKSHYSTLSAGSSASVEVTCDFQISKKCRKTYRKSYKDAIKTQKLNGGKIICLQCSRCLKSRGRNNPNSKYSFNDRFFEQLDSEGKAYLLGWIASDGTIRKNGTITIELHAKDKKIFDTFNTILNSNIPVKPIKNKEHLRFSICSTQIVQDVCRWLKITPGKKCAIVQFPEILQADPILGWAFIRGIFDGDGCINNPNLKPKVGFKRPNASISSSSDNLRESIFLYCNIPGLDSLKNNYVSWDGNNAIDFLGRIYDGAKYYLQRKFEYYRIWATWVPGLSGSGTHYEENQFKCVKTRKDAIIPTKANPSDSGYDVTLLEKIKEHGEVEFYDTGIKIQPAFGFWLMLIPRSSISKTGYMLANQVGVIDRTYTGNIIVALRKIDKTAQSLSLPIKLVQLIPMPALHCGEVIEVSSLEDSVRGAAGFGSTGR